MNFILQFKTMVQFWIYFSISIFPRTPLPHPHKWNNQNKCWELQNSPFFPSIFLGFSVTQTYVNLLQALKQCFPLELQSKLNWQDKLFV